MSNWVGGDGDSPQTGYKGLWGTMSPAIVYRKLSQLQKPGPARTFVFLDERRDSINDGCFVTELDGYPNAAKAKIVDYPAGHHSGGGAFGFADGHSEIHRWEDRRTIPPFSPGGSLTLNVPSPNNPDVLWLQAHSSGLP